ncbi:unnamed protein product [Arabis nemorensis]|uniref:Uncharacterized protein n=1 Tax=Arabis nemorensis TaxID=586526 RepID=A0A565BC26_9BRAS|nr:unnamed protein product [Arabis nemorensis]
MLGESDGEMSLETIILRLEAERGVVAVSAFDAPPPIIPEESLKPHRSSDFAYSNIHDLTYVISLEETKKKIKPEVVFRHESG